MDNFHVAKTKNWWARNCPTDSWSSVTLRDKQEV